MPGIVDAHIHVWSSDFEKYPLAKGFTAGDLWLPSFTPDDYFRYASKVGQVRINLVQMTWYGLDHRYITDLIAAQPHTFVGTGIVPAVSDVSLPSPDRTMKELARQGIYAFRVRGRCAQPNWGQSEDWLQQEGYMKMFTAGAEENLAISFLAGPDDLHEIDRMCERFPDTPVIIDHVGGVRIRGRNPPKESLESLCRLARHRRVMVKLGPIHGLGNGKAPFEDVLPLVRRIIDSFGPDHCMWESDSGGPIEMEDPERDFVVAVDLIREADFLSATDKELILEGSAAGFFFDR